MLLKTHVVKNYLGKELKKASEILRQKLDTKQMFDEWSTKVLVKCRTQSNKLFLVDRLQKDGKMIFRLKVNYAPENMGIAKEVLFLNLIIIKFLFVTILGSKYEIYEFSHSV